MTDRREDIPPCPYCDATLQPERLSAGRWLCPVCARVFVALPKPS